jgi:hypothetical protein
MIEIVSQSKDGQVHFEIPAEELKPRLKESERFMAALEKFAEGVLRDFRVRKRSSA